MRRRRRRHRRQLSSVRSWLLRRARALPSPAQPQPSLLRCAWNSATRACHPRCHPRCHPHLQPPATPHRHRRRRRCSVLLANPVAGGAAGARAEMCRTGARSAGCGDGGACCESGVAGAGCAGDAGGDGAGEGAQACGLGACQPPWLQRFATPLWFLVVYGLLGTTQAMAVIYFVATLTTLEKRFKIPSRTAGILMSGNEISQILLSLVLSFYGGRGNRPMWIAAGVGFAALSCFILALPHAVYGAGPDALALTREFASVQALRNASSVRTDAAAESAQELCFLEGREQDCNSDNSYAIMPLILIFFSQFVLGVGTTLFYALGQTYLDDNTKKSKTPLMLGLVLALRTIGPAFGFLLGFACLSIYIDPTLTPLIDKDDPRWLGAWWLGWVILGCLKLSVSVLIALFPKELPKRLLKKVENDISSEIQPLQLSSNTNSFLNQSAKEQKVSSKLNLDFLSSLKRLLGNSLLMCNNLSTVFYILGASGYITFMMKYMETQFEQAAANATGFSGCVGISAMVIGFLLSGVIISKYKPRASFLLSWNVLVGLCYVTCEIVFIFLSCPNTNPQMENGSGKYVLLRDCNTECNCSNKYSPVCDVESNTTFYSACYAGCTGTALLDSSQVFTDCSCLSRSLPSEKKISGGYLKSGTCSSDCERIFYIFLVIQFFMHLLGNSGKIGNILITYRCVNVEDKSFAQGLTLFMVSLFAFIPGPIVYGAIIDSTCLVWEESCGHKGNCWLYDTDKFRLYINLTAACFTFIGVFLDAVVCYLGKSLQLYDEDEDETIKLNKVDTKDA